MSDLTENIETALNDKFEEILSRVFQQEIKKFIENNPDKIADTTPFRKTIIELIERFVPTEIGNRLRCGIYDNNLVKEVFEKHFEECLRKQLKEEITYQSKKLIKEELKRQLKDLMERVND